MNKWQVASLRMQVRKARVRAVQRCQRLATIEQPSFRRAEAARGTVRASKG